MSNYMNFGFKPSIIHASISIHHIIYDEDTVHGMASDWLGKRHAEYYLEQVGKSSGLPEISGDSWCNLQRTSMIYGSLWISMGFYGVSMDFYGFLWVSMGFLWGFYGGSMGFYGNPMHVDDS